MTAFLNLDLDQFAVDSELVKRVPYGVAQYYLALPVAQEDGLVSVVMAHPENSAALTTLRSLLHAEVLPLRGPSEGIRAAIDRLYPLTSPPAPRILVWSASADWDTPVHHAAALFGVALSAPATFLDATHSELEDALAIAAQGDCILSVLHLPEEMALADVVRRSATPLVLVRNPGLPFRRILVAARGFASDDLALRWVKPLARQPGANITLMPLTGEQMLAPEALLRDDNPTRQHIERCLQHLESAKARVLLKYRPGDPVDQVVAEIEAWPYDLLVIAAEARGEFVGHVLDAVQQRAGDAQCSVLVIKPLPIAVAD